MKRLISLAVLLGMFASTAVFADDMNSTWNSPECVFSAEADEPELRAFALEVLLPGADKNQAMLIEDLGFKDTLIATQMVVCEGKSAAEALTFIGL